MKTKPRRGPLRCQLAVLGAAVLAVALGVLAPGMPEATAENNGAGLTPAMGWSSWSFLRHGPTARNVEAQARAMVTSGLTKVGYSYVNLDDFWYICPGSQGPQVDKYGRWVPNPATFPPGPHGQSGIQVVGAYVHSLGLKFGLYVTPGISRQAVVKNTPILAANGRPSGYTAAEIGERSGNEYNYNCGGMVRINYKAPGAQDFIDSWADEFASWGIDYLKLDGVGSFDIPDVKAWSQALRQTGRPIHLELSNSLDINFATTWAKYSNGWRTGRDIECYSCESGGSSYPLTDYASVETRLRPGRCVASVRKTGRVQRLRLDRSRERQQRWADPARAGDSAQLVGAGLVAVYPGHQLDPLERHGSGPAEERGCDRRRPGRHRRPQSHEHFEYSDLRQDRKKR